MIITIDGPAGSGKSTAARELASRLGIAYLDTGATFRAVTLKALRAGANLADSAALAALARAMKLEMMPGREGVTVRLDGRDVTREIRSSEVTASARYAAASPEVRGVLVELQRRLGAQLGDFVTEGRDQGSVVFPHADVKFYLTADARTRAQRRCDELLAAGQPASLEEVLQAIVQRDASDRGRTVAPLVKPAGAIEIDTTGKSIEQVASELLAHVEAAK